jgi:hypothetical protein
MPSSVAAGHTGHRSEGAPPSPVIGTGIDSPLQDPGVEAVYFVPLKTRVNPWDAPHPAALPVVRLVSVLLVRFPLAFLYVMTTLGQLKVPLKLTGGQATLPLHEIESPEPVKVSVAPPQL